MLLTIKLTSLLSIFATALVIKADDACIPVGTFDFDKERPPHKIQNIRKTHRLPQNRAITTKDETNGVRVQALDRNKVSISNIDADVMNKNMFEFVLDKAGTTYSTWYWLDKGGWCYAPFDYVDIYDVIVYVLDDYGNSSS